MEVTALCFRLLMLKFTLLNTQKSAASSLHITPNRLQHFEYESVSFNCAGMSGPTQLRGVRNTQEFIPVCHIKRTPTGSSCTANNIYQEDSGEYWCETEGGERSNSVNISVTAGSVILESPVLPVEEGNDVTLTCRNKTTSSNMTAGFYKDGVLIRSSSTGEMTIHSVSKSDEGLYKCHISGAGGSPESWMAVRDGSVILESPVLPVTKGDDVSLTCRNKTTSSHLTAGFYKDGVLIRSSSTGEMTIYSVSNSDEGLYKCHISGAGESPESWMAVGEETTPTSSNPTSSGPTPWIVTTLLLMVLLLVVGLLHLCKGYGNRVLDYLSTVTLCSSSAENQTVSVEAGAADEDKVMYAAVTKNRKKKDVS
ncbi:carcinoembryonic antigen-related cell adhesion molecule 20-like [Epinephelus moara]|uniref:carcinoembryonic antigen-related cell adhesion molecule 20-like n=1 Tax=Epinephelus moara TaxID=300413 RepID=UPI00214F4D55|nr:carcinoembryonic antigen-related cell adhesion molecule 20-like [Epinephelus moara]